MSLLQKGVTELEGYLRFCALSNQLFFDNGNSMHNVSQQFVNSYIITIFQFAGVVEEATSECNFFYLNKMLHLQGVTALEDLKH